MWVEKWGTKKELNYLSPYIFRQTRMTQPTKVAGTLRRAVRSSKFAGILSGRHMECAYYFDFCRLCRVSLQQIAVYPAVMGI